MTDYAVGQCSVNILRVPLFSWSCLLTVPRCFCYNCETKDLETNFGMSFGQPFFVNFLSSQSLRYTPLANKKPFAHTLPSRSHLLGTKKHGFTKNIQLLTMGKQPRRCSIESSRFSCLAETPVDNAAVTLVPHPVIPEPGVRTADRA